MGKIAQGRLNVSWQSVMNILARGNYRFEAREFLPKLPKEVYVHSVYNEYTTASFSFILNSREPVEGWTSYVAEGEQIPQSPAAIAALQKVVESDTLPENIIKTMTLQRLLMNINNDLREDADSGIKMSMTIEEYLNNLYNETE